MSSSTEIVKPKSPWAKIEQPKAVDSLIDVMSEQLATDLQEKESSLHLTKPESSTKLSPNQEAILKLESGDAANVDSDLLLAQLLQLEFDKEHDEMLKKHEQFKNKNSRVAISYENFKSMHPITDKDEKELNSSTQAELSSSSESEDEIVTITFKRGVHGKGENMISKHDLTLSGRHNASKVNMFPPEFETGDTHAMDMRLSNKVYNTLKMHSVHEEKRNNRLHDKKDKATSEMSLDPKTKLILFKLVNADILDSIGGIISTGKEATIFHAPGGKSQEVLVPKECVAKVFKTTLNEFKTREKYIGDDYRFKDRYKHLNPRKIVKLWAEKEMHNLMKMRRFEIPCPDVIVLKKHVLIMSLIGEESTPAPKLKDAQLSVDELKLAYDQCVQLIYDLYHNCGLVHADFNQFNLLWFKKKVWVIDVSQSVEPIHPLGLEFLLRDCANVFKFFSSKKLEDVKTGEEIFNYVTGMSFKGTGTDFLSQIQKYTKDKQMELKANLKQEPDKAYNFDYYFERSLKKKLEKNDGDEQKSSDEEESESDQE